MRGHVRRCMCRNVCGHADGHEVTEALAAHPRRNMPRIDERIDMCSEMHVDVFVNVRVDIRRPVCRPAC